MTLAAPAPLRRTSLPPQDVGTARVDASAGKRAAAYLIDFAIVAIIGVLAWFLTGSILLTGVAAIELWAIGWVWEGHTGATPGNLLCGIRTVQRGSALTVGAVRLLPRSLLMGAAHVIPVLLPVSLAASGALDAVVRARVVDVKKLRQSPGGEVRTRTHLEDRVAHADSTAGMPQRQGPITRVPTTAAVPAAPGPAAVPAATPAPQTLSGPGTIPVFELSDGTVIRVTGLGFIGRAPRAPESVPDAILVRVPDGARSLSRTHASFGIEDDRLWVQDLGSANGASIRHLGGSITELTSRSPYFLVAGDVLILGGDAELAFHRRVDRAAASAAPAQPTAAPTAAAVPDAPVTPEPAPLTRTAPGIALQFHDGTTVPIRGSGYIGRAPSLPEGEQADAVLVTVPDGDRSVSRTHGRFGIVDNQTWFEDLGSGNGSALRTGDGRSGPMTPNQRFSLVPGMVLQLGDCVIRVIAS
ncbi:putative transmembrane protein, RDD family domain [Microbacterium esteraromaticum]|uniref:Putative transmembrane protein, RDD family domain n=1 Tax=Microbacterium esteraromaticum TaxID=57043 RepID=A0A1R4KPG0_9MICO|nr:FHA domain-containing protein [Microbacterium esteraromaticum]SJN46162.1 putative transmembrane protein, RDD family domain [Microbacterium esteraromaticum]